MFYITQLQEKGKQIIISVLCHTITRKWETRYQFLCFISHHYKKLGNKVSLVFYVTPLQEIGKQSIICVLCHTITREGKQSIICVLYHTIQRNITR